MDSRRFMVRFPAVAKMCLLSAASRTSLVFTHPVRRRVGVGGGTLPQSMVGGVRFKLKDIGGTRTCWGRLSELGLTEQHERR